MVYEMPCPAMPLLFVASTLKDEDQAQSEIREWAQAKGYATPQEDQTFVFYRDGSEARKWRLIERSRPA